MIFHLSGRYSLRIFLATLLALPGGGLVVAQQSVGDEASSAEATEQPAADEKPEEKPAESDAGESDSGGDDAKTAKANNGQADLDEAVIKRIDAESEKELEAVAALLESALQKGLDEENESFARKMLGSVLLQRSQQLAGGMMQARGRRQLELRDEALRALKDAIANDPGLVEAYLLIARLNMLPGGDRDAVTEATTEAIDLLKDNPAEQSNAYVLRALTREDEEKKLADLDRAIELNSENLEALQARAALRLQQDDVEGAIEDLEAVLLKDPTNQTVASAAVQKLLEMQRVDDAIDLITKILAAKPSEGMYRMRAILYRSLGKPEEALSDVNKAIAMQPRDPMSLIQRAQLALDRGDVKSAKQDFRSAQQIAPQIVNLEQAIEIRSAIALEENRLADAINDALILAERDPDNIFYQLRLATLYSLDKRPRKAIEIFDELIEREPGNAALLRSRGDALLSVGEHKQAIDDYEKAIEALGKVDPEAADERKKSEAAGIYNNLSWVLATSPKEDIRNGQRALELGEKAAELSDYSEPHILSTLAAAYAETGNFDKALEWSQKAVELGAKQDHEQLDQLKNELEAYKKGEPWREVQETEENQVPILSPEDLIDT